MIPLALPSLLYLSPTLISSKTAAAAAAAAASSSSSSETRQDKTRHKTSFSDEKPNEKREVLGWEGCLVVLVDSSRGRVDKLASGPKRRTRQPSPMAFNLAAACLSSQTYFSTFFLLILPPLYFLILFLTKTVLLFGCCCCCCQLTDDAPTASFIHSFPSQSIAMAIHLGSTPCHPLPPPLSSFPSFPSSPFSSFSIFKNKNKKSFSQLPPSSLSSSSFFLLLSNTLSNLI